jgi:hypothetical protein
MFGAQERHNNNGSETKVECVDYKYVEHVWIKYYIAEGLFQHFSAVSFMLATRQNFESLLFKGTVSRKSWRDKAMGC